MKPSRSQSSSGNIAKAKKLKQGSPGSSGLRKPPPANKEEVSGIVLELVMKVSVKDAFEQYLKGSYKKEITVTDQEEQAIDKLDDKQYFHPHDPSKAKNLLFFRLKQLRTSMSEGGVRGYNDIVPYVRDALNFEELIKNPSWLPLRKLRSLTKKLNEPHNRHQTSVELKKMVVKYLRDSNLPPQSEYEPEGQGEDAQLKYTNRIKSISVCILDFIMYLIDTNETKRRDHLLERLNAKLSEIEKDDYIIDENGTIDESLKQLHQTQFKEMIAFLEHKAGGKRGTKNKTEKVKPVMKFVQKARR
jgi:hypothetical protein